MNAYWALVISIILGIGGQLSLKTGAVQSFASKNLFVQPYVILGLFCYFCAALLYTFALKVIPLSVAFPSVSISYIAVAFLAHILWGEAFGLQQIAALLLIGSGIYVLYRP